MPAKCISSTDSDTRSTPDSRSGLSDRESWDRRSERSMESQLSVACLQGRIQQMEENHHRYFIFFIYFLDILFILGHYFIFYLFYLFNLFILLI